MYFTDKADIVSDGHFEINEWHLSYDTLISRWQDRTLFSEKISLTDK